ncbi:hypothetical protein [Alkalimarinus coralli]|uniref:hypothetical protein n=1 Tax=Alkalimarinus coralli TaxID=2935863 RepID=UPI00202AE741|nr:hypothetical protein [Alkalimarinus coralli]
MSETVVVCIVVIVALIAHIGLFNWIKFKMDEAAVVSFFKAQSENAISNLDAISASTGIRRSRVSNICHKSKALKSAGEQWCLSDRVKALL